MDLGELQLHDSMTISGAGGHWRYRPDVFWSYIISRLGFLASGMYVNVGV